MRKALATLAIVATLMAPAAFHAHHSTGRTVVLKPCASEDSDNCYWDAATRGNGRGTSFVVIRGQYFYAAR